MRKLASVQKISNLAPIEGADRIEVATVNGWKVVVQKGLYEVGDLCCYFEIDSVLPVDKFPELEKYNGRIKTIRLRGQLSQGYCIPMETLGEKYNVDDWQHAECDWSDLTEFLGVTKYEPPITFKDGESKGDFPSHILPKTDEDRIQSNLDYLERMKGRPWIATVKYDGSSMTAGWLEDGDEPEFFVCSRNLMKKDGDNVFWNMARKYNLQAFIPLRYILQGEVVGPGIQKNHLKLQEIEFHVFRIYDKAEKRYLSYYERFDLCKIINVPHVECNGGGPVFNYDVDHLLAMAEGCYKGTKNQREGLVFEADEHVDTEFGGHLSFKVINNKFLLKGGD